ncbi:MAG: hypothetical protein DI523_17515 [Paraburkholderia fungorum]|nr:MAG: hypothetical protein DI523_17515 [Paraburkholderia fungorum]
MLAIRFACGTLSCQRASSPGHLYAHKPVAPCSRRAAAAARVDHTGQYDFGGTARHGTARHGTARHGTARHGTARHGTARHGTALGLGLAMREVRFDA